MDEDEIRRSAELEQRHWWYAGRRALVRRELGDLAPGRALDVGCGPAGNSAVLAGLGWQVTALDYVHDSTVLARRRGLAAVQSDARALPFRDGEFDLVLSSDAWEHIEEDAAVAAEAFRVLRPGGTLLVMVPAGMDLWSGHDLALGHVRRYERDQLVGLVERAGFRVQEVFGWNVLLRPVARARRKRRSTSQSEMEPVHPVVNAGLRAVVGIESLLPVRRRRGISLVLRATRD
ncbi:MAG: class I SAM-dependent methyltransferase [Nocardioidaceae bacterium]|nr:class I SAM-dependent methyltransferase [Nocardioidaceae bacterium]